MSESPEKPENEATPAPETSQPHPPQLPPQAQQQRMQLEIDDSKVLALYANFCRVTGSPEELIIDFGLNPQPVGMPKNPIAVTQRCIVNYYTAKRLLQTTRAADEYDAMTRGKDVTGASNNSWGSSYPSQALADAIDAQRESGILFIAAAGSLSLGYPAGEYLLNIIAVAATTPTGDLAWFSPESKTGVHVAAQLRQGRFQTGDAFLLTQTE